MLRFGAKLHAPLKFAPPQAAVHKTSDRVLGMKKIAAASLVAALAATLLLAAGIAIPPVWRDSDIAGYRLPLAGLGHPPKVVSEQEYYALPEVNLKTYPVYAPDKEPAGYMSWLEQQEPQPLVDITKLKTEADWIAAGREVFYGRELPRFSGSEHNLQMIRNPQVVAAYHLQQTSDGVLLGLRYVVREKGKVELGTDTCAMCHVQIRDGKLIEGAANVYTPFGPIMGDLTRRYAKISPQMLEDRRRKHMREDYRVPFLKDDPNVGVADLDAEQIAGLYDREPLGVHPRTNTSLLYPVKISNLIGIQDLKFFDHTATAHNRGVTDLMRYAGSIADVTDALTLYGDSPQDHLNLANMGLGSGIHRTPDALLFALAKYIYSLQPPANPNPMDDEAKAGQKVFLKGVCSECHTPPLYTSNKLTLALGFEPTDAEKKDLPIINQSLGTDPGLALKTRKGTGFYRVPTLRMVWMDKCFLHDCSVGTLEELFDPNRLKPDFRASNWTPSTPPHAVKGHDYGLDLSPTERAQLIKFLKTL